MITKKLTIGYIAPDLFYPGQDPKKPYVVNKAGNSTEYLPGTCLDKATVDQLCASNKWDVTIIPATNRT